MQGMGHIEGEGGPKTLIEEYLDKVGSEEYLSGMKG